MDTSITHWILPVGAIIAALIAGLFSFFNLVLSKEQKLSELRQKWIDKLRDDLAILTSAMHTISYIDAAYKNEQGHEMLTIEYSKAIYESKMKIANSYTRILLRLNPDDKNKDQKKLLELLDKSIKMHIDAEFIKACDYIPEIRKYARLVLKEEWKRVKKGEPAFVWSKRIALCVLIVTVLIGGYLVFEISSHPNTNVISEIVESTIHNSGTT